MKHLKVALTALALALPVTAGALRAEVTEQTVYLVEADGTEHAVATLHRSEAGYDLVWDEARFDEAFLSMRPFKCLSGPGKQWCRVPYPYQNARQLGQDLTDLEYDLLFIWKASGDYGIDMWNGVYYLLSPSGEGFEGQMHSVDLGRLAVPPDPGDLRPIAPEHLDLADPENHWLPGLRIR